MVLTWFGHSYFKLQAGDVTVAVDPYDAKVGLKPPRFSADLLLITHDHYDHANREAITGSPFTIDGPGEYEVRGCTVYGLPSWHDAKGGAERGANTMYRIELDGLNIIHLGDLGQATLTDEQLGAMNGVDVLLVPVGGRYTVGATEAAALVAQLEPRVVVPMHYKLPKLAVDIEGVEPFLKAVGLPVQREQKLRLSRKDLAVEGTRVVVLEPNQ